MGEAVIADIINQELYLSDFNSGGMALCCKGSEGMDLVVVCTDNISDNFKSVFYFEPITVRNVLPLHFVSSRQLRTLSGTCR